MSHLRNPAAKPVAGRKRLAAMRSPTRTERRIMEALARKMPERRITLRGLRLLIAYHEAGHVVARMFTGQEVSHVASVSIVPKDGVLGRETTERCTEEATIEVCPSKAQRQATGRQLLIGLLAGRGAIARLGGQNSRDFVLHGDPEEWKIEGSDLFRANRLAKIMAGRSGSPRRILEEAAAWTSEMLEIPVVWRVVKRFVGRLLKDGSIEGETIMDVCDEVVMLGASLPEWRQRLYRNGPNGASTAGAFRGASLPSG